MSVHGDANGIAEIYPKSNKGKQLVDLTRVLPSNGIEQVNLSLDQRDIVCSDLLAGRRQLLEPLQGVAAENDALIGFGWGHAALHGRSSPKAQYSLTYEAVQP